MTTIITPTIPPKSHAYWERRRTAELDATVRAAHLEGTTVLMAAILASGFASMFVPDAGYLTYALLMVFALFFFFGGSFIAAWLERFDRRFRS